MVSARKWPWSKRHRVFLALLHPHGGTTVLWNHSRATAGEWTERDISSALNSTVKMFFGMEADTQYKWVRPPDGLFATKAGT